MRKIDSSDFVARFGKHRTLRQFDRFHMFCKRRTIICREHFEQPVDASHYLDLAPWVRKIETPSERRNVR
jgi:hypothetical protein